MFRTPLLDSEIWKLKNKDKPKIKENVVPPNLIDSPIDQRNLKDENVFMRASSNAVLDELAEATQYMRELFEKEVKDGNIPSSMSYSEWLESLRTKLNAGGKVSKAKIKEPAGTKQIDLMPDFHKLMGMLSKMSPQERRSIQWLLDRGLGKKK